MEDRIVKAPPICFVQRTITDPFESGRHSAKDEFVSVVELTPVEMPERSQALLPINNQKSVRVLLFSEKNGGDGQAKQERLYKTRCLISAPDKPSLESRNKDVRR